MKSEQRPILSTHILSSLTYLIKVIDIERALSYLVLPLVGNILNGCLHGPWVSALDIFHLGFCFKVLEGCHWLIQRFIHVLKLSNIFLIVGCGTSYCERCDQYTRGSREFILHHMHLKVSLGFYLAH